MPPEIVSEHSKQVRLTLPYFSDKTGEGAAFSSKTIIRCGDTLSADFLWAEREDSLIAEPRQSLDLQKGKPSLNRDPLKVEFLSCSNGGYLNCYVIQSESAKLRLTHAEGHRKQARLSSVNSFSDVSSLPSPKPSPGPNLILVLSESHLDPAKFTTCTTDTLLTEDKMNNALLRSMRGS